MSAKLALHQALAGDVLSAEVMAAAVCEVMSGDVAPEVTAGLLCVLAARGETVDELTGAALAMREKVTRIAVPAGDVMDTCGTGGDGAGTFNISTETSLVVAACGITVAKHGNRAVSSKAGSADVLEALGVNIAASPAVVERCVREVGIGFLFAQRLHPAMKHAAPIRRALGVRTLFNLVGPLTNPAFATHQLLGIFDGSRIEEMAAVLGRLGVRRAWVVHGDDGLDELTLTGATQVASLSKGQVGRFVVRPSELGLEPCRPEDLSGGDASENAALLQRLLDGALPGPREDVVVLNAAAALVIAERVESLAAGLMVARAAVRDGLAAATLRDLVEVSNGS